MASQPSTNSIKLWRFIHPMPKPTTTWAWYTPIWEIPAKEREALQKATAANDHFAPAFVNLARLEMKEHNFAAAEARLEQSDRG